MTAKASVVHCVPGRIRLRVGAATSTERGQALDAVATVREAAGIESVRTDARTGSALVTYDPERLDIPAAIALIREAHTAFVDVTPPQLAWALNATVSRAGRGIGERFAAADNRVRHATHGTVDLRALIPIGLAGLSARQLLRKGFGVGNVPWYVLAYYSFDSFIKLHGGPATAARPAPGEVGS